jgi:hypothetical protein
MHVLFMQQEKLAVHGLSTRNVTYKIKWNGNLFLSDFLLMEKDPLFMNFLKYVLTFDRCKT